MMTKLIERYVVAALDRIPSDRQGEVGQDIRGAIDEIVEQRVDSGEPEAEAVRSALTELGDPARLAASYHESNRYLIGPGWYPAYIDVLKRVVAITVPVVSVIAMVLAITEDDARFAGVLGAGIGAVIDIGLQVLFWVTLAFVIGERTMGPDGPARGRTAWTPDDLPQTSLKRQIGLADTLFTVIALGFFGILAFLFHERALGRIIDDVGNDVAAIPLLNPDLPIGWVVVFYGLISLSIVVAVDRYFVGYWTRPMFLVAVAENVLWIAFAAALAVSEPIVNPALAQRVDEASLNRWDAGGQANLVAALIVVVISVWDVWEAWQGNRGWDRERKLVRAAT